MATFTFLGFDNEGRRIAGARNFSKKEDAEKYLEKKGWVPQGIFASKTKYSSSQFSGVSPKELSIFCRQMSVMYISQITIMEGLLLLAEQTENKQLKKALLEIHERMNEAYAFRDSISMYPHIFGAYLINMVMIGEDSGSLDSVFSRMANYFEKEDKVKKKLKSAIAYPLVLTVLMVAIVMLLIIKILPMFQHTLETMGGTMPVATRMIFTAANFISEYAWAIAVAVGAAIILALASTRSEKGRAFKDKLKITAPISSFVNSRVITARYSRGLSILLKSGVQLLNAMESIATLIDNKFLEEKFKEAFLKVKEGESLVGVLKEINFFPPLFLRMVAIGHDTGHLDEMLDKTANIFDDEVDEAVEKITLMVEPALIIMLSIVVGIILLSVMLPMISIMNAIG
ncbi:MAG: type II secretion system F family protein [Clostridiales bacterium]|nr:type II secretion system F family protein [Clostridiales bacterium]